MYKSEKPKKPTKETIKKPTKETIKKKTIDEKLKEHSKHHSAKHMTQMKKDIKLGMSFTAAHNKAMKSVGK